MNRTQALIPQSKSATLRRPEFSSTRTQWGSYLAGFWEGASANCQNTTKAGSLRPCLAITFANYAGAPFVKKLVEKHVRQDGVRSVRIGPCLHNNERI